MGFREGAFATIWEVTNQGDTFSKVRMSTSRKDKKTDEYVTDFSGFVSLIGEAHKKLGLVETALAQEERCRIKLGACDVSNRYDQEAKREYTNFTLFDFEVSGDRASESGTGGSDKNAAKKSKPAASKKSKPAPPPLGDDPEDSDGEDLPF